MAIAFDAGSSLQATASGSTTVFSWNHECTGLNRVLLVGVSVASSLSPPTLTGINYISVPMTLLQESSTGGRYGALYYLVAPGAAGPQQIEITFSSAPGSSSRIVGCAASYTGVDQTTPVGTSGLATGSATDPSINITSAAGGLVVDSITMKSSTTVTLTVGAGQTQRHNIKSGSDVNFSVFGGMSEEAGAGTVTMSWTKNETRNWTIIGVPLQAAPEPIFPPFIPRRRRASLYRR